MGSPESKKQKTEDNGPPAAEDGPSDPKADFSLHPHDKIKTPGKDHPFLLVVLDGWGEAPVADDNAISQAETPTMDKLREVRY